MNIEKIIDEIQNKIISLLRESKKSVDTPLSELCVDSCSELSRLSACWLSKKLPGAQFIIVKGVGVKSGQNHDVLVVVVGQKRHLIDATIWQFFPDHESILLGNFDDEKEVKHFLENTYGGEWSVSEDLTEESFKEKNEWEKVIRLNI